MNMVSKQRSIFDKEPVKVRSLKNQTKTEDEFVSIEDTIFCQRSIYKEDNDDKDDDDTKFVVHDDEVPFDESIFAKSKKKALIVSNVFSKEYKIDLEELFNKYKDIYAIEYILNVKRLNIMDVNTFNTCCINLEESRKTKVMNIDSTYDLIKRIIKSVCTCTEDVFCCYTNMNRALLDLISELNPSMDTFTMYQVLDRSYVEVIDEFGGKAWQR